MAYHIQLLEPSGCRPNAPTPVMMWPSGRFQPWGVIAFQPHIILSKDTTGEGPSPLSIHLKNLNKGTKHVSSQALLIIHVGHTRWNLHHICILKLGLHTINNKVLVSKFEPTQQDRVSNNQNNMIENRNQNQISRCNSVLIWFIIGYQ